MFAARLLGCEGDGNAGVGFGGGVVAVSGNSKWGIKAITIRTTAPALCYTIAEYAAPVWARSTYADILDPELNKACRAIT